MKKIFIVLVSLLFLGVKQAQADVLPPPTPLDPIKSAINCVYFKDFNKNPNLFLVDTKKKVLVTDNLCVQDQVYIKLFDKRIITPELVFKNLSEDSYFDLPSISFLSKGLDASELFGLKDVIKKDAPIKTIDKLIIFGSATSSIDLNTKTFNNFYSKYIVNWTNGKVTEIDEKDFQKLLEDFGPAYNYHETSHYNYNPYPYETDNWPKLLFNIWTEIFSEFYVWLFLLVTILVESLVFWFFGARRLINFIYLVIVNFISFNFGFSLVGVWPYLFPFLRGNSILPFLTAEILIIIIEFLLLTLFLRKKYPVKQLLLFSVVANFITAFLSVGFVFLFEFLT